MNTEHFTLSDVARETALTNEITKRTADGKGKLLRRERHRAWVQYGPTPPGLLMRFSSGIFMLCIHLLLIMVSFGLWLLVLLLIGTLGKDHLFRVDVITVNESGAFVVESVDGTRGKKLVKSLSGNSKVS